MSGLSRRRFLVGSAAVTAGLATAGPFSGFVANAGRPRSSHLAYGPLRPVKDLRDGQVRLELPAGFNYRSFHPRGTVLPDGAVLPGNHDGMAAFPGRRSNTVILVRNHEVNGPGEPIGGAAWSGPRYDPNTRGGTTSVEVDRHGKVLDAWVSLSGTQMNCAGGPTPWGSWLTCEETVNGADVGPDFTGAPNVGLLPHGYMFEVPVHGTATAEPIRSAGRFAKEAAAVTPDGAAVYITEDNFNFPSGLYRYTPPVPAAQAGRVLDGGVLEMLKVVGVTNADLSGAVPVGTVLPVEWVVIDDPDPTFAPGTTNDQAIVAVGDQGRAKGAAIFSRLEGADIEDGVLWFTSTQGGATNPADAPPAGFGDGRGQVWAYDLAAATLRLVYESPAAATLDLPDNVVLSPSGSLVLCEDGSGDNFLRGLTADGDLFDFARNADPDNVGQEFAGATFSPDGHTLFVNIQSSPPRVAYSIAIWGPWARGPF